MKQQPRYRVTNGQMTDNYAPVPNKPTKRVVKKSSGNKRVIAGEKALRNTIIAAVALALVLFALSFATEFYPFYVLVKGWPLIAVLFVLGAMGYVKDKIEGKIN